MEIQIVIENGKIFIESRETTNPTEIGYAIIDAIQEGYKVSIEKHQHDFDFIFKNKDLVYLIHDIDQLPRMITATIIEDSAIMYELTSGPEKTRNYSYEISRNKTIF